MSMETMRVVIGSNNEAKIEGVRRGFERAFDCRVLMDSMTVPSNVSHQPFGHDECKEGAEHRAKFALDACEKAIYAVGVESGFCLMGELWFECGWIAVCDHEGKWGYGITPPIEVADFIVQGMQHHDIGLGGAIDAHTGRIGVKHNEGYCGIATNSAVSRAQTIEIAMVNALARFLRPDLFVDPLVV